MFSLNIDLSPIYLFYILVGVSAALLAEGVYLLFYTRSSYRKNINRRLRMMEEKQDREGVLVQIRRERGLTSGGDYRLPLVNLNQLVLQSGVTIGFGRLVILIAVAMAIAFGAMMTFEHNFSHSVVASLFCGFVLPVIVLRMLRARRQKK